MLEWEWYTDTNVKVVFIHCLLKANFTQKNWRGITIDRGSFITSYSNLANETGLTVQKVRTSLKKLETTGEITIKTTNKYTVISIKKYDSYQQKDSEQQAEQQTNNNQITNNQQTNNNQITTTKNDKNEKNDKNDKNIDIVELSPDSAPQVPYKEIIDYLNNRCGTNYRSSTRKTKDLIKARYNEGFTLDDFKTVIDKKAAEWLNDSKMSKYLRPETLFGTKFEGYLNQKVKATLKDINLTPNMDLFD